MINIRNGHNNRINRRVGENFRNAFYRNIIVITGNASGYPDIAVPDSRKRDDIRNIPAALYPLLSEMAAPDNRNSQHIGLLYVK
jgi:hypothetical protein